MCFTYYLHNQMNDTPRVYVAVDFFFWIGSSCYLFTIIQSIELNQEVIMWCNDA